MARGVGEGGLTRLHPGDTCSGPRFVLGPSAELQSWAVKLAGMQDPAGKQTSPSPVQSNVPPSVMTASLRIPSPDSGRHQEMPVREEQITTPPTMPSWAQAGQRNPASGLLSLRF